MQGLRRLLRDLGRVGVGSAVGYTWAGKPAANAVPAGTEIVITDVGIRTKWVSDGTNWYPSNGMAILFNKQGSITAPLGSITSAGAALLFGAPVAGLKIPAGMLVPGKTLLRVNANWSKSGAGGGGNCVVTIGTTNSFSDAQTGGQSIATGSMWPMQLDLSVDTSTRLSATPATLGVNVAGASGSAEYTANVNTAVDMFMNFGSTSLVSGDIMVLTKVMVSVFQAG